MKYYIPRREVEIVNLSGVSVAGWCNFLKRFLGKMKSLL